MLPLLAYARPWERRRQRQTVDAIHAALEDEGLVRQWSPAEIAVLRHAARGDANPVIAAELGIGTATVSRILRRFATRARQRADS